MAILRNRNVFDIKAGLFNLVITLYLSASLCCTLSFSLSLPLSVTLSLSLSFTLSLFLSLSLSLSLCYTLSLPLFSLHSPAANDAVIASWAAAADTSLFGPEMLPSVNGNSTG